MQECEERFGAAIRAIRDGQAVLSRQKLVAALRRHLAGAPLLLRLCSGRRPAGLCRQSGLAQSAGALGQKHVDDGLGGRGGRLHDHLDVDSLRGRPRAKAATSISTCSRPMPSSKPSTSGGWNARRWKCTNARSSSSGTTPKSWPSGTGPWPTSRGKRPSDLADATARKQRERAEADKKYPALLKDIADRRDSQLQALDDDFQQKMTALMTGKKAGDRGGPARSRPNGRQNGVPKRTRRGPRLPRSGGPAPSKFFHAVSDFDAACQRSAIDWSAMRNGDWKLPEQVLRPIRIGHLRPRFCEDSQRLAPRQTAHAGTGAGETCPLSCRFPRLAGRSCSNARGTDGPPRSRRFVRSCCGC